MNILLTGSDGFIGRYLRDVLSKDTTLGIYTSSRHSHHEIKGDDSIEANPSQHRMADLETDLLDDLCHHIDCVIHLAARAHVTKETHRDPENAFYEANVVATLKLAESALKNGVKRFIFISSIGVLGDRTLPNQPFSEESPEDPHSLYVASKYMAEMRLREFFASTAVELLILRLPLVAHLSAPANFGALVTSVGKKMWLPFAHIENQRSLLSVNNLASFLHKAIHQPQWFSDLYLLADPLPYTTSEILQSIATAKKIKSRLFYIPASMMHLGLTLLGKKRLYHQLWGSLSVNSQKAQKDFGWNPSGDLGKNLQA